MSDLVFSMDGFHVRRSWTERDHRPQGTVTITATTSMVPCPRIAHDRKTVAVELLDADMDTICLRWLTERGAIDSEQALKLYRKIK
jgi:hypothetical protein